MSAPKRFPDRVQIVAVRAEAEPLENGAESPEKRRLAGRVMARRDMGNYRRKSALRATTFGGCREGRTFAGDGRQSRPSRPR